MSISIPLGNEDRVRQLYSYPNAPNLGWSLAQTVLHWFDLTLKRDGYSARGAAANVTVQDGSYTLVLDGPAELQPALAAYAKRLPVFLQNGWEAIQDVVPKIQAAGAWDPSPNPTPPPYHPWQPFLPHGMALLSQKAVQFFHYPPIRLLVFNQDYLDDPVPVRCAEMLSVNQVADEDRDLFNVVIDACPIGAEDNQGSKPGGDPEWGLIPIQYFHDYQRAQVTTLLSDSPSHPGYTVPLIVYGAHPRDTFNELYGLSLRTGQATLAEIIPGKKTPVMAMTHPYVFYGTAQGFDHVGSGVMIDPKSATAQMQKDLAATRWLKQMADDPTQDPSAVLSSSLKYWQDPAQAGMVDALVQHQGSLYYSDPTTLKFEFLVPLKLPTKAPALRSTQPAPLAPADLRVLGDDGQPVDWWFIYKVAESKKTKAGSAATGTEYAYLDSTMAGRPGAKLKLSPHRLDREGALANTLQALFSPQSLADKRRGWLVYNDEDHLDARGKGTGPADRGHCKGLLAFDLDNGSAFWLVHSVPLFPQGPSFAFPESGHKMAQSLLCIQLANVETARRIAALLYQAHGPNVFLASDELRRSAQQPQGFDPASLPRTEVGRVLGDDDPLVLLMQDHNASEGKKPAPFAGRVAFRSRGGQKFLAIGKNRAWGNPQLAPSGVKDFYNDLVAQVLNEDIDVETWEDAGGRIPPEVEQGSTHKVENMQSVDLSALGIPYAWSEKLDHAKLAISDRGNPAGSPRWVCVGDINFTDAQERRGGGTVAFQSPALWSSLSRILSARAASKPPGGKTHRAPAGTTKATRPKMSEAKETPSKGRSQAKSSRKKEEATRGTAKRTPAPMTPKGEATGKPARATKSTGKKPAATKGTARKPAAKQPAARTPAGKRPAAKTPVAKKPAVKKPAGKRPATKKPAKKPASRRKVPASQRASARSASRRS